MHAYLWFFKAIFSTFYDKLCINFDMKALFD